MCYLHKPHVVQWKLMVHTSDTHTHTHRESRLIDCHDVTVVLLVMQLQHNSLEGERITAVYRRENNRPLCYHPSLFSRRSPNHAPSPSFFFVCLNKARRNTTYSKRTLLPHKGEEAERGRWGKRGREGRVFARAADMHAHIGICRLFWKATASVPLP